MVKTVGKYDLYGTLGEGAFGKVKYAVNTETNEAVAIKILDKDKIQARNMGAQIKKEISIMKMINHHHVVAVKDVFATSAKIFIVLEFVGGGELFDKIANEGKLPEDKARFYFKQLVEGLEHCHNNGICHRDLKPENLLLDTDGNLKISDFGFSTLNIGDADGDGGQRAELLHTTCGTPNYVAPEVLGKDGYDGKKADVWSCGVILYVLLAGYFPFDENTMAALFQKIKNADYEFPEWFSPDARDLIKKILVPDPFKRPRLAELKNHPWMLKSDSGPSPITPIDHAAAMGAPRTVNTHGPSAAAAPSNPPPVPVPATNGAASHPPSAPVTPKETSQPAPAPAPAPAPIVVDKVNDRYSLDKAAVMSTPTNAALQAAAASANNHATTTSTANSSAPAAKESTSNKSANGHHQEAPKAAPAPKATTPPPAAAPAPAPAPSQPAPVAPKEEPKKAPAAAAPQPANSSNQQQRPPSTTTQPSNKPAPPAAPQQRTTATNDVDTGLFCCGGRPAAKSNR